MRVSWKVCLAHVVIPHEWSIYLLLPACRQAECVSLAFVNVRIYGHIPWTECMTFSLYTHSYLFVSCMHVWNFASIEYWFKSNQHSAHVQVIRNLLYPFLNFLLQKGPRYSHDTFEYSASVVVVKCLVPAGHAILKSKPSKTSRINKASKCLAYNALHIRDEMNRNKKGKEKNESSYCVCMCACVYVSAFVGCKNV